MKKTTLIIILTAIMTSATAQSEIKTYGDTPKALGTIQGVVRDSVGPVDAFICEKNCKNEQVGFTYADLNGNFSFKIIDPVDSIEIKCLGYHTIKHPISGSRYDIVLQRDPATYKERSANDTIMRDRTGFTYDENHPILHINEHRIDSQKANWGDFDNNKDTYDKKEIAHLLGIDEENIKEIIVLKSNAAIKKWGSQAKNGSIDVWTKSELNGTKY